MMPRQNVISAFIILVIIMIVTNLILLSLYVGWKVEYSSHVQSTEKPSATAKVSHYSGMSSIRFLRTSSGRITLFTPVNLMESEVRGLVAQIETIVKERHLQNTNVRGGGYFKLEGRLKRALEKHSGEDHLESQDPKEIWKSIQNWPALNSQKNQNLGLILRYTNKVKILQTSNSKRGTQLKMEFVLDGGQIAIFKPKWYESDVLIQGDIYGGKDRHFGEIASFYLGQLLGYFSVPVTVGRRIDLRNEVLPSATPQLNSTFYQNNSQTCFYGVCFYCKIEESICSPDGQLDGAMILLLNSKFKTMMNPWRRTYKSNIFAPWETDKNYCDNLSLKEFTEAEQLQFILDAVAVSIFDFLIGNGDRHHFEIYLERENYAGHSKSILLIDNGKSFGNPYEDYIDILAPLFQCCKIRSSLWQTLQKLKGKLGKSLSAVTAFDPLFPLLTEDHLKALDARLEIIYSTVQFCTESNSRVFY